MTRMIQEAFVQPYTVEAWPCASCQGLNVFRPLEAPRYVRPLRSVRHCGTCGDGAIVITSTGKGETQPTLEFLGTTAASYFDITLDKLRGKDRRYLLSWPRQMLMAVCYQYGHTMESIGEYLGRDHTTVVYGVKQTTERERNTVAAAGQVAAFRQHVAQAWQQELQAAAWEQSA